MSTQERLDSPPAGGDQQHRLMLTIAYDGSTFHGFAANPGVKTVGNTLADALAKVLGHGVDLTCAGRTDAGVHAWGQVVHVDVRGAPDLDALQRSVNKMLGPAIVVRDIRMAPPDFDARRSAIGRRYCYTVLNRPVPDPFLAGTAWHVEEQLDVDSMQEASDLLIGEHDWSAFCRRPGSSDASMVRLVREACWVDAGDGILRFEIEASAFCHQMVRSVVGTLVAVGRGRKKPSDIPRIIRSRDRSQAGAPAPPHGLCLTAVRYG